MSAKAETWWRIDNPIMWALLATAVFGLLLVYLGSVPTCNIDLFPKGDCPAKWRHIVAAPINEVGDTLAGLAGVLAFIWLVATVLLQAHELREQRKEFREQREATQDMARAMAAQAAIFEDEKRYRAETRAEELLDQKIRKLRDAANQIDNILGISENKGGFLAGFSKLGDYPETSFFKIFASSASTLKKTVINKESSPSIDQAMKFFEEAGDILQDLDEIQYDLSAGQVQRLQNMNIDQLNKDVGELLDTYREVQWSKLSEKHQ